MYVPAHYRFDDPAALRAFVVAHEFALVITAGPGGDPAPRVSHLPVIYDPAAGEHGTLYAHLALANDHQRVFTAEGVETLVVFSGPHAYISPTWYGDREHNVPTWNYVAVHARGTARRIEDAAGIDDILRRSVDHEESALPQPWHVQDLERSTHERMRRAIVGIEMPVRSLTGKAKLSQSRDAATHARVTAALRERGDAASAETADWMTRFSPR